MAVPGAPELDPLGALARLGGVPQAVAAARLALDRVSGHRVLRRRGDAVRTESALRGAAAAASIELGRLVDVDEVRVAAQDRSAADPVVRGAARAYVELGALVGVWRQAPRQALARLHTLAARDVAGVDELGRPGPGEATDRLAQLAEVLAATRAPALVVAAVVHGELATLAPFGSADRVVAMAASRLVLVERGLDPGAYAVVELGHQDRPAYEAALRGFATGTGAGLTTWVRHYGDAVQAGALEALAIAESMGRG